MKNDKMATNNLNYNTYDNYEDLLEFLLRLSKNRNLVYRGYSLNEHLLPNLLRKKFAEYELTLLDRFERYGRSYFSATNPIDFMSQAQHYGLPTRLLDFTHNPFIALYFAIYSKKVHNIKDISDKDYYYIRFCDLEDQISFRQLPSQQFIHYALPYTTVSECINVLNTLKHMISISNIDLDSDVFNKSKPLMEEFDHYIRAGISSNPDKSIEVLDQNEISSVVSKFKQSKLLFVEPSQGNQRLIMQQGLFLFPYDLSSEKLSRQIEENTNVIRIHKKLRQPLQTYLENLGITAYRLMPDLSNICAEIERTIRSG